MARLTSADHAVITFDHIVSAITQIGLGSIRYDVRRLDELLQDAICLADSDAECKVYVAILDLVHQTELEIAQTRTP